MSPISIQFESISKKIFPDKGFLKYIIFIIKKEKRIPGQIGIIFLSRKKMLKLNKTFLTHSYHTDTITFNYAENRKFASGEIFVAPENISINSKIYEVKFRIELYRVIIHGALHLIGYEDKPESRKILMTKKENYYLKRWINRKMR